MSRPNFEDILSGAAFNQWYWLKTEMVDICKAMGLPTHFAQKRSKLINKTTMHNNILDEPEKETNPRTCPACGFQFPFWTFVRKYAMAFGFSRWSCQSCGQPLTCDYIKMQVWWLLGLLPCALLMGISLSYFGLGVWNLIFLFPFYTFVLLTLYYAKFERYE